ncbi:ATP-binding cassette domain-containing protein [Rhodoblastus acidophilus]|uniref:ATP-binding cassette domain-containing protein n=1 Tax=Rhodoblastus acidophilus TaxID=1074 RepID=A0A6N8DVW5_RHOAC|nr:ABC transporter ATP-binding protein [Rhodoblastus acidophilus]MCW2276486.1 sulfonate transport system ATP-binding protein [Rhodoblastus acidophilus]MTV33281.1 ATP-binding cassette domain-containing protein [Rhodoblastus acidophilus]
MIEISNVSKRYPNGRLALSGLNLTVEKGEILAIVGGSGCGKSTLLRLLAGLDRATSGDVSLNGSAIAAPRAEIGLVFQEPRLMPWLKIEDNIAFGILHLPADERRTRVGEALERVGLAEHAQHWPRELSGGQAQRAALARALVARPEALLLDEPFSALDALTRSDLQQHLLDLWAYDQPTMILVTHDIEEALFLADRVVVMQPNPGRVRAEFRPPLARPRDRLDGAFHDWKHKLLAELGHANRPLAGEEHFPAAAI